MSKPTRNKTNLQKGIGAQKVDGTESPDRQCYLNRIVRAADLKNGDSVVEVGAGLGVLTEALVEQRRQSLGTGNRFRFLSIFAGKIWRIGQSDLDTR